MGGGGNEEAEGAAGVRYALQAPETSRGGGQDRDAKREAGAAEGERPFHGRGQKVVLAAAPLRRAGVVAPLRGFGSLVEILLGVLGRLCVRCARRCQKAGQVPAGWRMWQAFMLKIAVSGVRPIRFSRKASIRRSPT